MAPKKPVNYAALKKGGFMRQKQKGFFSMRLKVVGGYLNSENVMTISKIADKYGHGYVHLTARQGVEIPYIYVDDVDEVKQELAKGGLEPSVCGPRVRTVTACQGNEVCPSGCIDTRSLAIEFSERYFGRELPHKFKFGVTGCINNCLKAEENDFGVKGALDVSYVPDACISCGVCIKACRSEALSEDENGKIVRDVSKCNYCGRCVKACPTEAWLGEEAYIVSFGGLFGREIVTGDSFLPVIKDKETLFRVADATINFFAEHAKPSERFRNTLRRVGFDLFKEKILEAYNG